MTQGRILHEGWKRLGAGLRLTLWYWRELAVIFTLAPGLWWLSQLLQKWPVSFLIKDDSAGIIVAEGRYIYSIWPIYISVIALTILFFMVVFIAHSYFGKNERLNRSRQQSYEQTIDKVRSLMRTIYRNNSRPRINIKSIDCQYRVSIDGDTYAERCITFVCGDKPAHFWEFWIDADPEAPAVEDIADIDLSVTDKENDQELEWLLLQNEPHRKRIAMYFPEMLPGEAKTLGISFRWPAYMRRIIDKGSTEFYWSYRSASENNLAHVKYTWLFDHWEQVKVKCIDGAGGKLTSDRYNGMQRITYEDREEQTNGIQRSVRLEVISRHPLHPRQG